MAKLKLYVMNKKNMTKYRIKEVVYEHSENEFCIQFRFMFMWFDYMFRYIKTYRYAPSEITKLKYMFTDLIEARQYLHLIETTKIINYKRFKIIPLYPRDINNSIILYTYKSKILPNIFNNSYFNSIDETKDYIDNTYYNNKKRIIHES